MSHLLLNAILPHFSPFSIFTPFPLYPFPLLLTISPLFHSPFIHFPLSCAHPYPPSATCPRYHTTFLLFLLLSSPRFVCMSSTPYPFLLPIYPSFRYSSSPLTLPPASSSIPVFCLFSSLYPFPLFFFTIFTFYSLPLHPFLLHPFLPHPSTPLPTTFLPTTSLYIPSYYVPFFVSFSLIPFSLVCPPFHTLSPYPSSSLCSLFSYPSSTQHPFLLFLFLSSSSPLTPYLYPFFTLSPFFLPYLYTFPSPHPVLLPFFVYNRTFSRLSFTSLPFSLTLPPLWFPFLLLFLCITPFSPIPPPPLSLSYDCPLPPYRLPLPFLHSVFPLLLFLQLCFFFTILHHYSPTPLSSLFSLSADLLSPLHPFPVLFFLSDHPYL